MPSQRSISCLAAALIVLVAQLSGCGFRLRGSDPSTTVDGPVFLSVAPHGTLAQELRRSLRARGVSTSEKRQDASIQLDIHSEKTDSRTLAIGTSSRIRAVELRYSITFTAKRGNGKEVEPTQLQSRREYRFDPKAVLGSTDEREWLYREMRRELIERILERLASLNQLDE